jgi:hypothetical protein
VTARERIALRALRREHHAAAARVAEWEDGGDGLVAFDADGRAVACVDVGWTWLGVRAVVRWVQA